MRYPACRVASVRRAKIPIVYRGGRACLANAAPVAQLCAIAGVPISASSSSGDWRVNGLSVRRVTRVSGADIVIANRRARGGAQRKLIEIVGLRASGDVESNRELQIVVIASVQGVSNRDGNIKVHALKRPLGYVQEWQRAEELVIDAN